MKRLINAANIVFVGLMVMYACNKREEHALAIAEGKGFSVNEAKSWYARNGTALNPATARKSGPFTVLWNTATTIENESGSIVECRLRFDKLPGFAIGNFSKDGKEPQVINGDVRLVIMKNRTDNKVQALLMNTYATNGTVTTGIHYERVPPNFDGYVFFTTLDGSFLRGGQYQSGKVIRTAKPSRSKSIQSSSRAVATEECGWVDIYTYLRTCYVYDDVVTDCSSWELISMETQYYCPDDGGGGSDAGPNVYDTDSIQSNTIIEGVSEDMEVHPGVQEVDPVTKEYVMNIHLQWKCGTGSSILFPNYYNWSYYAYAIATVWRAKSSDPWKFRSITFSSVKLIGTTPPSHEYRVEAANAVSNIADDGRSAEVKLVYIVYEKPARTSQTKSWSVQSTGRFPAP